MVKFLLYSLLILTFLLSTINCQTETKPTLNSANSANSTNSTSSVNTPTRYEGEEKAQIFDLLDKEFLTIKSITALSDTLENALPFGEVVAIHIKNETNKNQTLRIDCGTVLRALSARYQDLIVTRSIETELLAYGEWRGNLEVFSLQMRRHYPYKPATYQLGNLAQGDLRKLVEYFCFNHPQADSKVDLTPVQYAIWRVADNITLNQLLTYSRGRGNPSLEEQEELEKQVLEQGRFTDQILSDCQITAKFLDSNP
ncbi:MAG: hypothetical protein HY819_06400 [Acidobacteria bacterium]|nr:hypothetical protein [Acidobacteriota bacterium]